MQFQRFNIILGWVVMAISSVVYLSTVEPTASFWDCGEFIATAYNLEVGHPPGAPFFMILGRLFAAFVAPENAAIAINTLSALSSSFTILFLFWTITAFAKKMALGGEKKELEVGNMIAVLGSGLVGALCYTFSDSFWFSAVEGEVYAISSLFTAVVFWAIMKWDSEEYNVRSDRWIILIAYLMGLSIGVHLLNLLCIPAIGLVIYLKTREFSTKGLAITLLASLAVLVFVQYGIIPGIVKMAGGFELFFIDSLGTGFNIGVLSFGALLIALVTVLVMYAHSAKDSLRYAAFGIIGAMLIPLMLNSFLSGTAKGVLFLMAAGLVAVLLKVKTPNRVLHLAIMSFTVILIGYSSYAMIVIRSAANPPMDENNPENVFTLLSYLNREQYGNRPLLHGNYWMAEVKRNPNGSAVAGDGAPVYMKVFSVKKGERTERTFNNRYEAEQYIAETPETELKEEYIISDERKGTEYEYEDTFTTLFPRMYSSSGAHPADYRYWSDFEGKPTRFRDRQGNTVRVPTPSENFRFFMRFQVNHMYWRYFMWNFAGRQNDIQNHGSLVDGNWMSGVAFIDAERLGTQKGVPDSMSSNKARNKFYLIPLILGLIGLVFQLVKDTKNWLVIMLLFLLTGLAIVIYLNQYPHQPRERDYAYVGSFYAFAMWVGLGVYALYDAAKSLSKNSITKIAGATFGTAVLIYIFEFTGGSHAFSYTLFYVGLLGLGAMVAMWALGNKLGSKNSAILATLIGLVAPVLMAADGWDDHDRSHRRTAVDIAKNYLNSCDDNAILFSNGDNDTFPLWYTQEVEHVRTHTRVVNLSLLNTDWYIDQMRRKAYDSEPVPFSISEEKYRQGTRDLIVFPDLSPGQQLPKMSLSAALAVAMDDTKLINKGGNGRFNYLPTNRVYIDLDKEDLVARGIISVADTSRVADRMEWNIPMGGGFISKAQLMVLDLVNNNNWERPIYFAVTTGKDSYVNMQDYFELCGMTYKLTPFKHARPDDPNRVGGVNTEVMYDNVINNFVWGNMDTHELYMDENNLRLATNIRLQMSALADELIQEGKLDKAKEILDLTFEKMPERNVPLSRVIVPMINSYVEAGDKAKAEELSNKLFDISESEFNFYTSKEIRHILELTQEIEINSLICKQLMQLARIHNMDSLDDFTGRFAQMEAQLSAVANQIQRAPSGGGVNY